MKGLRFNHKKQEYECQDGVAVGDLNSDAKGSGARKNAGKLQMDLVPVRFWMRCWGDAIQGEALYQILFDLREWQEKSATLSSSLDALDPSLLEEAAMVFTFGAEKYKAWNWAKGMPWSVPTGCILRHAKAIIDGQHTDEESGCSHLSHIVCNLIMLAWYEGYYPEGDDRPPV